jgi:cystathionine beta-lyase/cystathionine gamma-synthase
MERAEGRGGLGTRAIHAGEAADPATHAHATPIYQTATFAFETGERKEDVVDAAMAWEPGSYFYTRTQNPTTDALERKVASLEGAAAAVACASGREMYAFVNALELCSIAVSLGHLKTLIYPMPKRDNLVRVSVGCEDADDLVADCERGLAAVRS